MATPAEQQDATGLHPLWIIHTHTQPQWQGQWVLPSLNNKPFVLSEEKTLDWLHGSVVITTNTDTVICTSIQKGKTNQQIKRLTLSNEYIWGHQMVFLGAAYHLLCTKCWGPVQESLSYIIHEIHFKSWAKKKTKQKQVRNTWSKTGTSLSLSIRKVPCFIVMQFLWFVSYREHNFRIHLHCIQHLCHTWTLHVMQPN